MDKHSQWRFVCFDGRIQSYFQDGSIIQKSRDVITYYSTKGNKIRIGSEILKHNKDIKEKLDKMAEKMTKYEDDYFVTTPLDVEAVPSEGQHNFFKKYKIQQFFWQSATVRQISSGYQVVSDDGNAKVTLSKDLYRILVCYPQKTGGRKITEDGLYLNLKNRRRQLIQKYGGNYVEYPQDMLNIEIEHQYMTLNKQFTMFALPSRWCPAMQIIWGYLLANQVIPHPFCYIDFEDPDNRHLRQIKTTKMPKITALISQKEDISLQLQSIPLYGKPNHSYKWKWSYVQKQNNTFYGFYIDGVDCVMYDGCGFWFIEGNTAFYKTKNKDSYDYKVNLSVFPLVIRFENQQHRDIKNHVLACVNYKCHRQIVQKKSKQQQNISSNHSQQILCQQYVENIGVFKAYCSKVIVAKFDDRTLMTIRNEQVTIIAPNGRSLVTTLNVNGKHPRQFREHLKLLNDWYQKIFYHEQWVNKQANKEAIERHVRETETFLEVTKHFQRRL